MNTRTRLALRTLLQGCPPAAIVAVLLAFGLITPGQGVALTVPLTALSSFLYNLCEDAGAPVPIRRE